MATVTICVGGSEFPNFSGVYASFKEQLMKLFDPKYEFYDPDFKYPLYKIQWPSTLTITQEMVEGLFYNPTVFILKYINALTQEFMFMLFKAILEALEPILGALPLPKVPCLNVDLLDILSGNLGDIHSTCSCGPKVASNLQSESSNMPSKVADCLLGYLKSLTDFFIGKIQDLIDYIESLELTPPGLPEFPPIPTKADILAMIPAAPPIVIPSYKIGDVEVPEVVLPAVPTLDTLFTVTFPGIDLQALIPNPLLEYSKPGAAEIEAAINALLQKMTMLPLELLIDFINEALGILGLDGIMLPEVCFPFPVIEL